MMRQRSRPSTGTGLVMRHSLQQIRQLNLHSTVSGTDQQILLPASTELMTSDQVLDFCLQEVPDKQTFTLVLELKHPNPRGLELDKVVIETLKRRGYNNKTGMVAVAANYELPPPRFALASLENC